MACHKETVNTGSEGFTLVDHYFRRKRRPHAPQTSPPIRERPVLRQESQVICRYPYIPQDSVICFATPASATQVTVITSHWAAQLNDDIHIIDNSKRQTTRIAD
ncbi:hypothetical protein Pfo_026008 [Paulownia fortunei]|nr:hypothetical protein Pfo_026008 [Paulownia fortunei]